MAKGLLFAYLLADPELSLQNILVTRKIMGDRRTVVYVMLVTVVTFAGLIFGFVVWRNKYIESVIVKRFGGNHMKKIRILGTGCARCKQVEENARKAVTELGIEVDLEHVTDLAEITEFGVTSTPALVIDQQVVCSGRIPGVDEIKELLASK